jgi:hypothetical protein
MFDARSSFGDHSHPRFPTPMPAISRRTLLVLCAIIAPMAGCADAAKSPDTADTTAAAAPAPAPVLAPFQQAVASGKAEVTLPGAWHNGYLLLERADTTLGSFQAIEFRYANDSARKEPSHLLLVIRVFKKAAWTKVGAQQPAVATKLAERGNDVYAYSIVTSNPYPLNSAAALRVDAMMLALVADSSPFKLTFK